MGRSLRVSTLVTDWSFLLSMVQYSVRLTYKVVLKWRLSAIRPYQKILFDTYAIATVLTSFIFVIEEDYTQR